MVNLVESIQKNLGYAALYKVNPNTQDIDDKEKRFGANSLAQAAIPAVLCGLFNYILQPGVDNLSLLQDKGKWLPLVFGNKTDEIVERIASYAGVSTTNAEAEMEHIASEAVRLIREHIAGKEANSEVRSFCIHHKNDALSYLPAALQLGELLGNNNLDDRTHKMEGPISSLMHSIERRFSGDSQD